MCAAAANCCSHVGQWSEGWLCSHLCIRLPFREDVLDGFECAITYLWICGMTSSKGKMDTIEEVIFFMYLHNVLLRFWSFISKDNPVSAQDYEHEQGKLIYQTFWKQEKMVVMIHIAASCYSVSSHGSFKNPTQTISLVSLTLKDLK